MNDQPRTIHSPVDPVEFSQTMQDIAVRSHKLIAKFMAKQMQSAPPSELDPMGVGQAFLEFTSKLMTNPAIPMTAGLELWHSYMDLWQNTAARMMGQDPDPVVVPEHDDRRFKDEAWTENGVFDFIKQSYLLTSEWMQKTADEVEGLDKQTDKKVQFYTRQFADALSPTNFIMTNPTVLRETLETGGDNLVKGLENLLNDLEAGDGSLKIRMSNSTDFQVGKDIATSPGKVVLRNDLMELIQFAPLTEKVIKTPLLIIPPWINKYYILDLRPKNSFVKWATEQGHTVFVISWVNPDKKLAKKTFGDYMLEGPLSAIPAVLEITESEKVNMVGYCIGGTLLASTLAYMAATHDNRVNTATYFASMVDFEKSGDLSVFIDEKQVESLEKTMSDRGFLEGSEMAATFNLMKANDLIWSFVVNNYLMGKDPFPFDLLYWNDDSTRMPAAMHSFYLRNMYMKNRLRKKGGITLAGKKLDLRKIQVPSYILATHEDHIAPWEATFDATHLYAGPTRFVLARSGHIAGIINPPAAQKYGYWTDGSSANTADEWFAGATQHEGSWWPDWDKWVKQTGPQPKVPARIPGDGPLPALCDAPGTYVFIKSDAE